MISKLTQPRIHSRLLQGLANLRGQLRLRKLFGCDVYIECEGPIRRKKHLPRTKLSAGIVEKLTVDGQDKTGLIRNRDKLSRHDQTFGTLPAAERLEPYNLAGAERTQ